MSGVTGAGGLGEGMLLVWEAEGRMGKIICSVGQCYQDEEGEALLALLWAEKDTRQTVPLLPEE